VGEISQSIIRAIVCASDACYRFPIMLLPFETRAFQKRLGSKSMPNFALVDLPVKIRGGVAKCLSEFLSETECPATDVLLTVRRWTFFSINFDNCKATLVRLAKKALQLHNTKAFRHVPGGLKNASMINSCNNFDQQVCKSIPEQFRISAAGAKLSTA